MIKHMSACEKEDQNQADGSPDVSILNQRGYVWPGNTYGADCTEECGSEGNVEHIIDWSVDFGMWSVRKVASNPGMHLFCRLRTEIQTLAIANLITRRLDRRHTHL